MHRLVEGAQGQEFHRPRARARWTAWLIGLVVGAVMVGMAAPATAGAADFIFQGRGWGSGVGMSQWGAWGAAQDGRDYRWILDFYYPGTTLEQMTDPNMSVKVKISSEPWRSVSTITQEYRQVDLTAVDVDLSLVMKDAAGEGCELMTAGNFCNVFLKEGRVFVNTATEELGPFDWIEARPATSEGRVQVELMTSSGWVSSGAREYWGAMRVVPSAEAGYLNLYNIVPMDQYLSSLGEVEYDWGQHGSRAYAPEAVKAQAVAARTYAVAQLQNRDFIHDNQWDQAYLGYFTRGYCFEERFAGIPQAARDTTGQVLTCHGSYVVAYFSAHSGGYTTAWETGSHPYLVAKPDPYSLANPPTWLDSWGPGYLWTRSISAETLSSRVRGMIGINGRSVNVGEVTRVEIVARDTDDPESHVSRLRITGSNGSAVVSGHEFRRGVGYDEIRSTLILGVTCPPSLPRGEFYDLTMYGAEIKKIVLAGLMGGYPNELFKPENPLTRWQFAKIAVNLWNQRFPESSIPLVDVPGQPFWDVAVLPGVLGDESDWVAAAHKAGLMHGVTDKIFKPYEPIRRDELATVMVRALGLQGGVEALPPGTTSFLDVPEDSPHARNAAYMMSIGVIRGYEEPEGEGTYCLHPDEPLKRMHAAVVLARALDVPKQ
ncbi:MAG: hypothetical protein GX604_05890 [Actinobacteria bacterium]|nr:hypothetical protein [Actinomycetota bacterium]